ncbi:ABC-2 transporter permease [Ornithinibacillus californiensis]|uniref:ABC-2 transporter permease n=1 Tax=Ornithinibacillus californiensis TaxID=161536 RepID=UPI00064DAB56|nr:ABC-2 transporter permease [Ornithinibacillus californiensis]
MKALLIRDFINYKNLAFAILILIPIGYITTLPPFWISLGLLLPVVVISIYFSEKRSRIDRFMISLPIRRYDILASRYITLASIWVFTVVYQFAIGHLVQNFIPYDVYTFSWKEFVALLSIGFVVLAFHIPLYSLISSFVLATSIFCALYLFSFWFMLDTLVTMSGMTTTIIFNELDRWIIPFLEKKISFLPYVVLPFLSVSIYYVSLKIVGKAFSAKELI